MKLIYSEIKKWLPDLKVDAKTLRDDLTLIGHFASGFERLDNETVLNLEIRQNRGDCLGYYGIARDLAVYYQIDLKLPDINPPQYTSDHLPVTISSPDVYRIQAVKISQIKNSSSPDWLSKFLHLHDINPINIVVDLTNYVMLLWGIPCHAFDIAKSKQLIWENNAKYPEFTSLDGTTLKLQPGNIVVSDNSQVLSLAFIGGQNSGIELNTTESILEMAVYNRSRVRSDSRSLKTITEASIRLDKELDTETIPLAFSHLISLICSHCQAKVTSQLFDIYNQKPVPANIAFDPAKPSVYAGIDIPIEFSKQILSSLKCSIFPLVKGEIKGGLTVVPPTIRKDLTFEEDLVEEVIRFYGYNKIPVTQPVSSAKYPDITPPVLYLIEKLKDELVTLGYDEIRSWPLVKESIDPQTAVKTQNSINLEYPYLRQSMIQSLQNQLEQYTRYKLPDPQFFEVGKIFSSVNGKYIEKYALGIYHFDPSSLKSDLKKLNLSAKIDGNFAEIILDNLEKPASYLPQDTRNNAIELTSQIITLDANANLNQPEEPLDLIKKYSALIDPKILWSMKIIDVYNLRYTFRVSYYNCDDKTAKKIHLAAFGLN